MFVVRNNSSDGKNHHKHLLIKAWAGIGLQVPQTVFFTGDCFAVTCPPFHHFKTLLGMRNTKGQKMMAPQLCVSYKPPSKKITLSNYEKTADFLISIWDKESINIQEYVYVVFLDTSCNVISWRLLNVGTIKNTLVDVKLLFSIALSVLASHIIIAHNHPSGSAIPSQQDLQLMKRIENACDLLDINLLDFFIITERISFSVKTKDFVFTKTC